MRIRPTLLTSALALALSACVHTSPPKPAGGNAPAPAPKLTKLEQVLACQTYATPDEVMDLLKQAGAAESPPFFADFPHSWKNEYALPQGTTLFGERLFEEGAVTVYVGVESDLYGDSSGKPYTYNVHFANAEAAQRVAQRLGATERFLSNNGSTGYRGTTPIHGKIEVDGITLTCENTAPTTESVANAAPDMDAIAREAEQAFLACGLKNRFVRDRIFRALRPLGVHEVSNEDAGDGFSRRIAYRLDQPATLFGVPTRELRVEVYSGDGDYGSSITAVFPASAYKKLKPHATTVIDGESERTAITVEKKGKTALLSCTFSGYA